MPRIHVFQCSTLKIVNTNGTIKPWTLMLVRPGLFWFVFIPLLSVKNLIWSSNKSPAGSNRNPIHIQVRTTIVWLQWGLVDMGVVKQYRWEYLGIIFRKKNLLVKFYDNLPALPLKLLVTCDYLSAFCFNTGVILFIHVREFFSLIVLCLYSATRMLFAWICYADYQYY